MQLWNNFAAKHPAAAKWVREGGLFVIVSNLVTVFKYLLLQFLPAAFSSLPVVDFGWPGIPVTLFGETFQWNILGYDSAHGGLPYFCAYMVAMVVGECINFPIQRNFVFRSKGNLAKQIAWYVVAFCLITCIVNSINCVWVVKVRYASNATPSILGSTMGERPVAMQILMPRSCKRCRVSNIFGVIFFACISISVPSISKKTIFVCGMGYLSFKRYTISIPP